MCLFVQHKSQPFLYFFAPFGIINEENRSWSREAKEEEGTDE